MKGSSTLRQVSWMSRKQSLISLSQHPVSGFNKGNLAICCVNFASSQVYLRLYFPFLKEVADPRVDDFLDNLEDHLPHGADESNNVGNVKGYSVGEGVDEPEACAFPVHATNKTPGIPPRQYGCASHLQPSFVHRCSCHYFWKNCEDTYRRWKIGYKAYL
ncbi:Uncharacterized protein Fot_17235 [Forsythia ovata]|uniref:Uncharacterized protein n=1 Tax=Forsythia ovata TaxID=205694 RepID=A0ABD1VES0_9LAMI